MDKKISIRFLILGLLINTLGVSLIFFGTFYEVVFLILIGIIINILSSIAYVIHYNRNREYFKDKEQQEKRDSPYASIIMLSTSIIYFIVSFITGAWHLTWILFLFGALTVQIVNLIRRNK